MEEKERYEVILPSLNGYAYIHDFKTDNVLNTYDSCDLLNQQDKENQQLKALLKATEVTDIHNELADLQINNEWLESENQQLKHQLKDTEESYNNTMRYLNKTRSELLNLNKKI